MSCGWDTEGEGQEAGVSHVHHSNEEQVRASGHEHTHTHTQRRDSTDKGLTHVPTGLNLEV